MTSKIEDMIARAKSSKAAKDQEPILSEALRKFAEDIQTGEVQGRQWITLVDCMNAAADQLDKYVKLAEKRRLR